VSYSLAFSQAIFILLYVANKVELGLYDYIPTQVISQELNIPVSTAGMILRQLSRAGLIETREGANGGVRLAVNPETLTILDIFTVIEQQRPLFQNNFRFNVTGEKTEKARNAVREVFDGAESSMKDSLKATTLRQLMDASRI
jgi:Rrf2 family protein